MTASGQTWLYEKLNEYYDQKKSFRKAKDLRVLELTKVSYIGAMYDETRYAFTYEIVDIDNEDEILQKIYDFKPDVIITNENTVRARKFFNHNNLLYININDFSAHLYLARDKSYPINEIVLYFQNEKIVNQIVSQSQSTNHMVLWDYVEDANFLDSDIEVSDVFDADILVAGSSNSSLSRTKRYLNGCMATWMLGCDTAKNNFTKTIDLMMDELYHRMDATGSLIDDENEYKAVFYEIADKYKLNLDFMKEIPHEDIVYFFKYLHTSMVVPVFRFLVVKWILERGYNAALWGMAWKEEESTKKYYKGTIQGREEMKQTYNKAKICLFTNPELSIHFSVFEIIGSKSLCLAYENEKVCCSKPFSKYFEDGKSITLFHDREELYQKLDYYLNNLGNRKQIIEQGNKIMTQNNICRENELSRAVHQAVKQAEKNGMFQ